MFPIDPTADRARRAWFNCPQCTSGIGCGDCRRNRNCDVHWQYLLSNQGWLLHLQCPGCGHLWSHDSKPDAASASGAA
ncbi:hypothetical protein GCM10009641_68120 [Mycobacterium cookii]|uniref:Uncharacterized protein n=1 Tax=Mycobacterium cookii TaxID=1775 RepID=A0A7I7KRN9_9MYCO|nr:hypothetical protein [Mycobacterium cookii]MCV7332626.1 hypothetical protein [Mycobacterium cookii]BBX44088.1 hypothetical protein MCOO_01030 [Mycobacterium cookii]